MTTGPLTVATAVDHLVVQAGAEGPPVLLVEGAGGSGVSTVVVAVAEALGDGRHLHRMRGRRLEQALAGSGLVELGVAADDPVAARAALLTLVDQGVLLVDDAHWLDDVTLQALVGVVERLDRGSLRVVVGHRPSDREVLGALAQAVAANGGVTSRLGPLGDDEVAARLNELAGTAVESALVDAVHEASGGAPWAVDAVLAGWTADGVVRGGRLVDGVPDEGSPGLVEALRLRLDALGADGRAVLAALAVGPAVDDALLAAAADVDVEAVAGHLEGLRTAGLLLEGHDEPPPAVAHVAAASATEADRRRLHDRVARALLERGGSPVPAAEHLVAAGSTGPEAAAALVQAAIEAMADEPELAGAWLDRASVLGAGSVAIAERARVALLVGDLDLAVRLADPLVADADEQARVGATAVLAVASGSLGRWARAAGVASAVPTAEADAVTALAALAGQLPPPPLVEGGGPVPAPTEIALGLARASAAAAEGRHQDAVAAALAAADLLERSPGAVALPDTPHAVGAMVSLAAGDLATAELLLRRAEASGAGGPLAAARHQLLSAWVALRVGRWAQARAAVQGAQPAEGSRDAIIRHALLAALARRDGDVASLTDVWRSAESEVLAGEPDLLLLDLWVEIAAAAARLEHAELARRQVEALATIVDGLGAPPLWAVPQAWGRLVVAVAAIDPIGAHEAADALVGLVPVDHRLEGLAPAAQVWADVLDGHVDLEALAAAVAGLEEAGRPWEASRLAGHAAVRVEDATTARSLLTQARELKGGLPTAEVAAEAGEASVLSDREREVARLVLDGLTHKEVGAQLYISPKTVEHHVAKIRTKLGASTRAEMLAALRSELA